MINLIARFKIQAGKEDEGVRQLQTMTHAVKANEPGALAYMCHRSKEDPSEVIFFESYKDEEALKAHRKTEHMKQMGAVFPDLFVGPPKIELLDTVEGFMRGD